MSFRSDDIYQCARTVEGIEFFVVAELSEKSNRGIGFGLLSSQRRLESEPLHVFFLLFRKKKQLFLSFPAPNPAKRPSIMLHFSPRNYEFRLHHGPLSIA